MHDGGSKCLAPTKPSPLSKGFLTLTFGGAPIDCRGATAQW